MIIIKIFMKKWKIYFYNLMRMIKNLIEFDFIQFYKMIFKKIY